jgi:hypothetical protein
MSREEYSESNGEIGVLHCGKRFRYSKKETVVEREEQHNEPCIALHITPYMKRKVLEGDS